LRSFKHRKRKMNQAYKRFLDQVINKNLERRQTSMVNYV
jgi:IS1 family transposase